MGADASERTQMPRAVVVLGMDRSGTSLCTQIVNSLGIRLGQNLIPPDNNNVAGYYEERQILLTHERALSLLGRSWDTIAALQPLPPLWWRSKEFESVIGDLEDLVHARTEEYGDRWGFKDPRTVVLYPLWREVFRRCNVQPTYIVCLRNPAAVAASLAKRDGFEPLYSELLWLEKTIRACSIARKQRHCVIHYEGWFTDPSRQLHLLAETVGAEVETLPGDRLAAIFREDLRHHEGGTLKVHSRAAGELYESLREKQHLSGVRLGQVRKMLRGAHEFVSAGETFRNRRNNPTNEPLSSRSPVLQRLTGDVTTRDAIIAELNIQLAEQRARMKALRDEVTSRDQLVNTLKDEVTSRDQLVNTLRGEATSRDQLVNTLKDEAASRDQLVNTLKGEAASREQLVNTLRDEVSSRDQAVNALKDEVNSRDQRVNSLNIELKRETDRAQDLTHALLAKDGTIVGLASQLSQMRSRIETQEGLLAELRRASKEFDARSNIWIQERRTDKNWQLMLAVRKAGSLLLRQGWPGRARFIRWALWDVPRGAAELQEYEPVPLNLRDYLPQVFD
jgi:hypothetical protein